MGKDTIVDAVESDDLPAVAGGLRQIQEHEELTEEDKLRALLAREYASEAEYPGIATYAEDVIARDQTYMDGEKTSQPAMAGAAGVLAGVVGWPMAAGNYVQNTGDIKTYLAVSFATGGMFAAAKRHSMEQQEDEPVTIFLSDIDQFDDTVQDVQTYLCRDHDTDTYGEDEIEVQLEYR